MKTLLLTGATGFLGSNLLKAFILEVDQIIILKRSTSKINRIENLIDHPKVISYDINLISIEEVFSLNSIDFIIHTACSYGRKGESMNDIIKVNTIFGTQLLDAAVNNNVKLFINTDSLLPRDINIYSLSKAQFTDWLNFYSDKIKVVNFKIEHMYGPGDDDNKFIYRLVKQLKSKEVTRIPLTSGFQKRDFVHISDIISAYMIVFEKIDMLNQFNSIDLGTGILSPVKNVVQDIAHEIESKYQIKVSSKLDFGAIPFRKNEVMEPNINIDILKQLGWSPKVKIDKGIKEII
ncbi:NAD-dependent epimerase/dehydratase family protein [Flammeovirga kamogawensis]|uniref:NAD-dependent epimerase/dehydratase family protein n=1 Tax=Flammeovirga kamogawensis TaxID=373891 RepID=A0ABX8GYL2_9BACT|nr:NAD-dependent epimerase/dehydratase family protein [Flammeovirga kamogawensis]MBB6458893.1 nucleoside-diphosphate-sugar epimerase [Flammeovirga kamogawensis]QWG08474.1 NAD-dependent epimerase/dehydratase family protein [Flammeovirga kamogawensis]TRX66769.1 NAD(P)-dependent oxidoreductase [Flammeovirga kamogawensis]